MENYPVGQSDRTLTEENGSLSEVRYALLNPKNWTDNRARSLMYGAGAKSWESNNKSQSEYDQFSRHWNNAEVAFRNYFPKFFEDDLRFDDDALISTQK